MSLKFEKVGRNPHVSKGVKVEILQRFSTLADTRVSALLAKFQSFLLNLVLLELLITIEGE